MSLPVAAIANELLNALSQHARVILSAPPGAGKSTWLPLFLLQQPAFDGKKILLLEPRRLAAKSIASFMASQLNEPVGQTVGYQVRLEKKASSSTRLLIVTEGLLTRFLQQDPELSSWDLLIFDEFHERSLQADLALALSLEALQLRDDLTLLLMSATLDTGQLAQALDAPVIASEGRSFPVEIRYQTPDRQPLWQQVARCCWQLLQQEDGSVLAFLPGQAEIRQAQQWLLQQPLPDSVQVHPLLGSLSLAQQQAAIAPCAAGQRKVVLATNLAETSLTIDGIRLVVDSGVYRRVRFYPKHGVMKLETVAISKASATQRAGRAGRLSAGLCIRLDSDSQWQRRAEFTPAEMLEAELTGLRLELAAWGAQPNELFWLDPPPEGHLRVAEQLLQQLGALSAELKLTPFGQQMVRLGTEPRLAALLCRAQQWEQAGEAGAIWLAAMLAVVLEQHQDDNALWQQLQRLLQQKNSPPYLQARQWCRQLGGQEGGALCQQLLPRLLCQAYPDRVAVKRGKGYLLANGAGAILPAGHPLSGQSLLLVTHLQLTGQGLLIRQAEPLSDAILSDCFAEALDWQLHTAFDSEQGRFISEQQRRLGACILARKPAASTLSAEQRCQAWLEYIQQRGLSVLPWDVGSQQWLARLRWWQQLEPEQCPGDWREEALLAQLADWLGPWLGECLQLEHIKKLPLLQALQSRLDYSAQQRLAALLPSHWQAPTGSRLAIDYLAAGGPVLAVRMQEVFGQLSTPLLAEGRLPLTLELLSPARRPLQRTADLASFWQNAYKEVRKEMKGRYPKHYWPEDPAQAMPTTKTTKAMRSEQG
ncbi:ATP-dependent helicase HrpB [Alkalimonas delamerensis]|uniref:ATP-dependent helicase HrpB n=1 Tax=Alkalimonas delamerensis TaxID=265981 RepID=A0ABT9GLF7_9GAMM|nr:ATP-dependent helicase HrpB [Alkalimonas delamerensis]MDP4527807.1 ATP-dependent helicase HrpB [Alkalimonas delamerensis]